MNFVWQKCLFNVYVIFAEVTKYKEDPLCVHTAATAGLGASLLNVLDIIAAKKQTWDYPSLFFVAENEGLVDNKSVEDFYESAKSKDKTFFSVEKSRHETLHDVNKQMVMERCIEWIKKRAEE